MAIGSPKFPQICTVGITRRCMEPGFLQVRTANWAFCTETRITFLGTAYPQLPFDINIVLVPSGYHGDSWPAFTQTCTVGPIRRCMKQGSLQVRTAKWALCTETRITFVGTAYP